MLAVVSDLRNFDPKSSVCNDKASESYVDLLCTSYLILSAAQALVARRRPARLPVDRVRTRRRTVPLPAHERPVPRGPRPTLHGRGRARARVPARTVHRSPGPQAREHTHRQRRAHQGHRLRVRQDTQRQVGFTSAVTGVYRAYRCRTGGLQYSSLH